MFVTDKARNLKAAGVQVEHGKLLLLLLKSIENNDVVALQLDVRTFGRVY